MRIYYMYRKENFDTTQALEEIDLQRLADWVEIKGACWSSLEFLRQYKDVSELLSDEDTSPERFGEYIIWMCKEVLGFRRWHAAEYLLFRAPSRAVSYAKVIIRGKFEEAEPYIAKNVSAGTAYARDVLRGRFIEAERYIAKSPTHAVAYAMGPLCGQRFPEAEPYIAKDAFAAHCYGKHILRRRWEACEEAIANAPSYTAMEYLEDYIKAPHPPFEKAISSGALASIKYATKYLKGRFPAGEKAIAVLPSTALAYAELLGERFPAGEAAIASSGYLSMRYAELTLKRRFVRGEPSILRHCLDEEILRYHRVVFKDRWYALENKLDRDSDEWQHYVDNLKDIGIELE